MPTLPKTTNYDHKLTIIVHYRLQVFVLIYHIGDFPHGQVSVFITLNKKEKHFSFYKKKNNNKSTLLNTFTNRKLLALEIIFRKAFSFIAMFYQRKKQIYLNFLTRLNKSQICVVNQLFYFRYDRACSLTPTNPNSGSTLIFPVSWQMINKAEWLPSALQCTWRILPRFCSLLRERGWREVPSKKPP